MHSLLFSFFFFLGGGLFLCSLVRGVRFNVSLWPVVQALLDRLTMFSFVKSSHLDIPEHITETESFQLAQNELRKMDTYKAPRDKMICVLNCCKIINNLLLNSTDKQVCRLEHASPKSLYGMDQQCRTRVVSFV